MSRLRKSNKHKMREVNNSEKENTHNHVINNYFVGGYI